MRYNNSYELNKEIRLVLPNTVDTNTIKVYGYVIGSEKYTVGTDNITINTEGDFQYIHIINQTTDKYLIVTYGTYGSEFIRIGNPPPCVLMRYIEYNDSGYVYKQYDYSSTLLEENDLVDLGNDIYSIPVNKIEPSFYVVGNNKICTLTLPTKYLSVTDNSNGTINLQRGNWQLIAIPKDGNVKNIFVDKLESDTNMRATDLIEICAAYPGHVNKFLSYIPGFTQETSIHNFNLNYLDNGHSEITAFWVKCKNWTHTNDDIIFNWE